MSLAETAAAAKAWPFEQARALHKRVERRGYEGGAVVFETGYGPSGLPHIGPFGEVARTSMVRHAFRVLTDDAVPTRLIAFSDDMDGFRKVPDNLPEQEMLAEHLGKPLTDVPDPFGTHESFAHHNNARLRGFLDAFGFDYEFLSSTEQYRGGAFDETLLVMLERFEEVMAVMLPTLGPERRATYSPFLPVSPTSGRVLQVPTLERNVAKGTIVFEDETGETVETPVTGGRVKVQWKPDWAMRWAALGVDYEMAGKDLIDSVKVSSQICRALGGRAPDGFNYELFLDENGEKISKSKGNGLTVEEWLRYAAPESLSLFMYQKPKTAKKLYFDIIPKTADEYLQHLAAYGDQDEARRLENPVWHIHAGAPEADAPPISFSLLLNLASAASAHDKDVLWGFISRYVDGASPESHPLLDRLAGYAVAYFEDFVAPAKSFRPPEARERAALEDLRARLAALDPGEKDGETIQNDVYAVGKAHEFEPLRDWFRALYEVLLGQSQGPRFGSFAAVYGVSETIAMIDKALEGELAEG
ncbi:MAG: lysine--tRNA ligase [Caulobacterales bacterium]|nr:lysine--tRNA ligase [Caulobacterales bacterium]